MSVRKRGKEEKERKERFFQTPHKQTTHTYRHPFAQSKHKEKREEKKIKTKIYIGN